MDIFTPSQDQLIAEYNALREEIIDTQKGSKQFIIATLTVVAGAVALAVENQNPYIALIGVYFAFCSLIYIKAKLNAMNILGRFIANVIEPRLPALSWESAVKDFEQQKRWKRIKHTGTFGTLLIYMFSMIMPTIIFYLINPKSEIVVNANTKLIVSIITITLIITGTIIYLKNNEKTINDYSVEWAKKKFKL